MTSTGGTMRTDPGQDRVAGGNTQPPVVRLAELTHRYGDVLAADGVTLDIPTGRMVGFIGPDGVGKSTWLGLIAGARQIQHGTVEVLGGDMADRAHRDTGHRRRLCRRYRVTNRRRYPARARLQASLASNRAVNRW